MKRSIDYWLIWKRLNDTLTQEEDKEFEGWLKADMEHQRYFEKLKAHRQGKIHEGYTDFNLN